MAVSKTINTQIMKKLSDGTYQLEHPETTIENVLGKATKAEAEAGTNNTKYMTPLRVKEYVDESNKFISGSVNYFESIPAGSAVKKLIAVTSGKTKGILSIFDTSKNESGQIELGGIIFFSTDPSSGKSIYYRGGSNNSVLFQSKDAHKSLIGGVVNTSFIDGLKIIDVYLTNTNIVIDIVNTSTSSARNLKCSIQWEVW